MILHAPRRAIMKVTFSLGVPRPDWGQQKSSMPWTCLLEGERFSPLAPSKTEPAPGKSMRASPRQMEASPFTPVGRSGTKPVRTFVRPQRLVFGWRQEPS